jgi:hypothetical protein
MYIKVTNCIICNCSITPRPRRKYCWECARKTQKEHIRRANIRTSIIKNERRLVIIQEKLKLLRGIDSGRLGN